ncbi:MAG: ribosome maturation factor RimM [Bacteroidaceae bacterium]|nr:ribosome maturation factor RimM [Bacteroidaceae bacterium]
MIRSDEVFQIGRITRTHGTKGELELLFTDDPFDRGEADYLVLELDGIMVPFFFTEWRYKGSESALFTFENMDSEQKAKPLVGTKVFYPFAALPELADDDELSSLRALTGFTAIGIGTIVEVDDSNQNVLLTIELPDGSEVLVPYHDDFLVDYDLRQRTITLELPEGLLELN